MLTLSRDSSSHLIYSLNKLKDKNQLITKLMNLVGKERDKESSGFWRFAALRFASYV